MPPSVPSPPGCTRSLAIGRSTDSAPPGADRHSWRSRRRRARTRIQTQALERLVSGGTVIAGAEPPASPEAAFDTAGRHETIRGRPRGHVRGRTNGDPAGLSGGTLSVGDRRATRMAARDRQDSDAAGPASAARSTRNRVRPGGRSRRHTGPRRRRSIKDTMDHDAVREQMELAAVEPDGLERLMAGDTPTAQAVAGHLAGCPACTEELGRLQRSAALVRETVRALPPADLRARTLAAVRAEGVLRPLPAVAAGRLPEPPTWPMWQPSRFPSRHSSPTPGRCRRPWPSTVAGAWRPSSDGSRPSPRPSSCPSSRPP